MCTTMIVTKGATVDGSAYVSHSDDDELSDQRIIYVPAQTHSKGAKRRVLKVHYHQIWKMILMMMPNGH